MIGVVEYGVEADEVLSESTEHQAHEWLECWLRKERGLRALTRTCAAPAAAAQMRPIASNKSSFFVENLRKLSVTRMKAEKGHERT